jgi:hypothetical protein
MRPVGEVDESATGSAGFLRSDLVVRVEFSLSAEQQLTGCALTGENAFA